MRHRVRGRKLNRTNSHRKALMRNLAIALITHKKIKTTDAKAKELRGFVERLITYAKNGDTHNRRLILQRIPGSIGKKMADILIHEIAPEYTERNGGYTRITKLSNRKNDNAPVSLIELVDLAVTVETSEEEPETAEE